MTPSTPWGSGPADSEALGALLDVYFGGHATEDQRLALSHWIADAPGRRDELERLRAAWHASGEVHVHAFDAKRAAFMARIAASVESEQRERGARTAEPARPPRSRVAAPPPRTHLRRWTVAGAGLAAAALLTLTLTHRGGTPGTARPIHDVRTQRGERAQIALADGTTIYVNSGSHVSVGERADGTKEVTLDGEAYFDVQQSSIHPFIVRTNRVTTQVLGTAFVVRGYAADSNASVAVVSGRVAVQPQTAGGPSIRPVVLEQGRQVSVSPRGAMTVQSTPTASYALASWLSGNMAFDQWPLHDVIAAFERQYDVQIRLTDAAMLRQRISGVFADTTPTANVGVLAAMLNGTAQWHGHLVTISPRQHLSTEHK